MIRHKQFAIGQTIYALMGNSRYTDVLFPIKGVIQDIEWDEHMPRYQLKIIKFYDSIDFLKRYLVKFSIDKDFKGGKTKFSFVRQQLTSVGDLERKIKEDWQSHLVVVDSVYCVKYEPELFELYHKIQDFFIEKKIKELFELSSRLSYKRGRYYYNVGEFRASLKKFLSGKGGDEKYYDSLLYRPRPQELDNIS